MADGRWVTTVRIREGAEPIDDVGKFAWADEDYEEAEVWVPYTEQELAEIEAAEGSRQRGEAVRMLAASLPEDAAAQVPLVFPEWRVGGEYAAGDYARRGGELYVALQASVGASEHPPESFVAGWKRVGEPEGGVMPWSQPLGATDAYDKGDAVSHAGKVWVSDLDANVWEPGVYGWTERG